MTRFIQPGHNLSTMTIRDNGRNLSTNTHRCINTVSLTLYLLQPAIWRPTNKLTRSPTRPSTRGCSLVNEMCLRGTCINERYHGKGVKQRSLIRCRHANKMPDSSTTLLSHRHLPLVSHPPPLSTPLKTSRVHTHVNHLWCPRSLSHAHTRTSLTNSICQTRMTIFLSRCSATGFHFRIVFYNYLEINTGFPSFVVILPNHRNFRSEPSMGHRPISYLDHRVWTWWTFESRTFWLG